MTEYPLAKFAVGQTVRLTYPFEAVNEFKITGATYEKNLATGKLYVIYDLQSLAGEMRTQLSEPGLEKMLAAPKLAHGEPKPHEVIRLLNLFNAKLDLRLQGNRKWRATIHTIGQGATIEPRNIGQEYELVLNNTVYIGWEDNQHVVYTYVTHASSSRLEPDDVDIMEYGRYSRAADAARAAVLFWCQILVDGVLEGDQEQRMADDLSKAEELAEKLKRQERDDC